MRTFKTCLAIVLATIPVAASAQQDQTPPAQRVTVRTPPDYRGLSPDDMKSFCFWAGQPYSIGSAFCSRQQTLSTCAAAASGSRPVWVNKDNDKLCDKNPSLTPQ